MSKVIGFDFGTTNSLISIILKNGQVKFYTDDKNLPHPSVVCYLGDDIISGRKAKERLDKNAMGILGDIVRSPKTLLGNDAVFVAGRNKHPKDIVAALVRFLQANALAHEDELSDFTRAVVTIPVGMDGKKRAALRDALLAANMHIVKFIHEPLAALYAYFRSQQNMENELLKRNGQLILVFDWGGGTLDLTLCKISDGMLVQIKNKYDNEVGGDYIDNALHDAIIKRHTKKYNFDISIPSHPGASAKLLNQCEQAKIELSKRDKFPILVTDYFSIDDVNASKIEVMLKREDLERISKTIVNRGISKIDELIKSLDIDLLSISLCLATGGMINMPAINQKLIEKFGLSRLIISDKGDRIISEGAAWIAHDEADLVLAKSVEVIEARNSYLPIFKQGIKLPQEGQIIEEKTSLYSVDPRDGKAKFQLCRTASIGKSMASDPRETYDNLTVKIDDKTEPFRERLELNLTIDDNLILTATAISTLLNDSDTTEIHDLEFGLSVAKKYSNEGIEESLKKNSIFLENEKGSIRVRSNVLRASIAENRNERNKYIPGELLYQYKPEYFDDRLNPPSIQVMEKNYYEPCPFCKKRRTHPECKYPNCKKIR
jgi:molecular chaperone DnaK (HSP70)